jgi:hypothetical protein
MEKQQRKVKIKTETKIAKTKDKISQTKPENQNEQHGRDSWRTRAPPPTGRNSCRCSVAELLWGGCPLPVAVPLPEPPRRMFEAASACAASASPHVCR